MPRTSINRESALRHLLIETVSNIISLLLRTYLREVHQLARAPLSVRNRRLYHTMDEEEETEEALSAGDDEHDDEDELVEQSHKSGLHQDSDYRATKITFASPSTASVNTGSAVGRDEVDGSCL